MWPTLGWKVLVQIRLKVCLLLIWTYWNTWQFTIGGGGYRNTDPQISEKNCVVIYTSYIVPESTVPSKKRTNLCEVNHIVYFFQNYAVTYKPHLPKSNHATCSISNIFLAAKFHFNHSAWMMQCITNCSMVIYHRYRMSINSYFDKIVIHRGWNGLIAGQVILNRDWVVLWGQHYFPDECTLYT